MSQRELKALGVGVLPNDNLTRLRGRSAPSPSHTCNPRQGTNMDGGVVAKRSRVAPVAVNSLFSGAPSGYNLVKQNEAPVSTNFQCYLALQASIQELEEQDLISSVEDGECPLCFEALRKGKGILLRDCLHTFCRECLVDCVENAQGPVKCPQPHPGCPFDGVLQEREIKALVPDATFEKYLAHCVTMGDGDSQGLKIHHCRASGCAGWCMVGSDVKVFRCPVCKRLENLSGTGNGHDDDEQSYQKMKELMENQDLVLTTAEAECPVCINALAPGEGIVLRECLHVFCRDCLFDCIQYADESIATVKCPYRDSDHDCNYSLQEREIKAIVTPDMFERYLSRSVKLAETQSANSFHCKTPDCVGWCLFEDNVNVFFCEVCQKQNCLTCAAIHEGANCKQYQTDLAIAAENDESAKKSLEVLKQMIAKGDAMHCPQCNVIINKIGGCDGLMCTFCKTEICWVTRGPRWGKGGRGDITGGCRCNVNGVRCHPNCRNCH